MEDKPLTDSINKQYSKYGSLRTKEKESKIELRNAEDPLKFLIRIDSSIKDAKARVKDSIDKSTLSEEFSESSYDQQQPPCDSDSHLTNDAIPMVKIERNKSSTSSMVSSLSQKPSQSSSSSSAIVHSQSATNVSNSANHNTATT